MGKRERKRRKGKKNHKKNGNYIMKNTKIRKKISFLLFLLFYLFFSSKKHPVFPR